MNLTVFTPAYNRAHTLPALYESLLRQTSDDFIWMVVDDGSTDNTRTLVETWQKEGKIHIIYIYKENGGMHTAHNTAYAAIDTPLNMCIDSDDYLTDNAVERILSLWQKEGGERYAGIVGLDVTADGRIIGTPFPEKLRETTLTSFYASGGKGDKKLVYRTDVVRRYPQYPVFEGEKYVGLNYLYNLIDRDYQLLVLNSPLVVVEYQEDGSSLNMWRQYRKNPKGWCFYRRHQLDMNPGFKDRLRICTHLVAHSIFARSNPFRDNPEKFVTLATLPAGILLAAVTLVKNRMML